MCHLLQQSMVPDPRRAPPPNIKPWDEPVPCNVRRGGGENAKNYPPTRVKYLGVSETAPKISHMSRCEYTHRAIGSPRGAELRWRHGPRASSPWASAGPWAADVKYWLSAERRLHLRHGGAP